MNRLTVPPALLARWQALAVRERQALMPPARPWLC